MALLAGFGAQTAAALDRERLRMQASQAEALAEGNRIRTALLAAVSHDLRTPLASIKASVSSLRQTDVQWTAADEADLLATIEQNADRLDALIGNLLDLSRLHSGSLEPFLRPTAIDEVAPVALRGLDAPVQLDISVPDGVPLVRADPGLLERVLANIFSNALRHSPSSRPPALRARQAAETVSSRSSTMAPACRTGSRTASSSRSSGWTTGTPAWGWASPWPKASPRRWAGPSWRSTPPAGASRSGSCCR